MHRIYLLLARHPRLPLLSLAPLLGLSLGLHPATSPDTLPATPVMQSPQTGANPCTLAPRGATAHPAAWHALLDVQGQLARSAGRILPCAAETSTYSQPAAIVAGPDGNLWFTQQQRQSIGRITPQGAISEYPLPPSHSAFKIAVGHDGNLWFTSIYGVVGRVMPDGRVRYFNIGGSSLDGQGIVAGPGGHVWYAFAGNGRGRLGGFGIGRISPEGKAVEFGPLPEMPMGLAAGPDCNVWFAEAYLGRIGRMTPEGQFTWYLLPERATLWGIATGPDNSLWFTEPSRDRIGRITVDGAITEYDLPPLR